MEGEGWEVPFLGSIAYAVAVSLESLSSSEVCELERTLSIYLSLGFLKLWMQCLLVPAVYT
jgi:hypothetical protein